jgi:hypothetical protein
MESEFAIYRSIIRNNGSHGLYANFSDNGDIAKSRIAFSNIYDNNSAGIYLQSANSPVDILNNLIYKNSSGIGFGYIYDYDPNVVIQNDTIVNNGSYGINLYDSTPEFSPTINSCIIWGNSYELYSYFTDPISSSHCCIQRDSPGQYPGEGNIYTDPCFANINSNNFHLKPDSCCIDAGDPNLIFFPPYPYPYGHDIDGEPRVMNERIDIGTDELFWPKADLNYDGIVNFVDYALLAEDWQEVNSTRSMDIDDNDVEIDDIFIFSIRWLWLAPWSQLYEMYASQPESGSMDIESASLIEEMSETSSFEAPIEAEQPTVIEPLTIEQMVEWLDSVWQRGELTISEEEYLDFRNKILESGE